MELVSVKVLVIGGVAAGTKAAAKLKREDRGLDVALITKDQDISYAGCGLALLCRRDDRKQRRADRQYA